MLQYFNIINQKLSAFDSPNENEKINNIEKVKY